jgi:hypothetical protein
MTSCEGRACGDDGDRPGDLRIRSEPRFKVPRPLDTGPIWLSEHGLFSCVQVRPTRRLLLPTTAMI